MQVADLTLRQVLRLKWPNGQGVPLAADVIRLLHASVQRLILDVKVQVGLPRQTHQSFVCKMDSELHLSWHSEECDVSEHP